MSKQPASVRPSRRCTHCPPPLLTDSCHLHPHPLLSHPPRLRAVHEAVSAARQQLEGCMDPSATNFNPAATDEDGSCVYRCEGVNGGGKGGAGRGGRRLAWALRVARAHVGISPGRGGAAPRQALRVVLPACGRARARHPLKPLLMPTPRPLHTPPLPPPTALTTLAPLWGRRGRQGTMCAR